LAVVLLAWRDARRQRRAQERIPIPDRIAKIGENAERMAEQLQGILDRYPGPTSGDWIPQTVTYYRRLGAIARDPATSIDALNELEKEASAFVRERHLKGIFVAQEARELAALVDKKRAA
jgi:hypothetical protein